MTDPHLARAKPPFPAACSCWSTGEFGRPEIASGGAAPNAVFGLVELLAKLKDAKGHINIPGIYDDVEPPSPAEKHSWSTLPFDEKEFLKIEVGSTQLTGEPGFTVLERVWARPTLEVHGIVGGFIGGALAVVPMSRG